MSLKDEFKQMGEWGIDIGRRSERVDVIAYLWERCEKNDDEDTRLVIQNIIREITNGDHIKEQS
jgi:hypothetical protein